MMRNKWIAVLCALLFATMSVCAATDVNTADEAGLQQVKGIGPARAKSIVAEREAHGPFKDQDDFVGRITGVGAKSIAKLTAEGLTFGAAPAGTAAVNKPPKPAAAKPAKKGAPAK